MSQFFSIFRLGGSGLAAQKQRLNTISSNIANAQTTRSESGGPYQRKEVVFEAVPDQKNIFEIPSLRNPPMDQVRVTEIVQDSSTPILKYDPYHPDANEEGYVAYPNINIMAEMANLIEASRSYEANLAVINSAKENILSSLEIGRV